MSDVDVTTIADARVGRPLEDELRRLLDACFPGMFPDRTFYKQSPTTRLLAFRRDVLVGQVGLDDRMIRVSDEVVRIAGIADLCVAPHERGAGIGAMLLQAAFAHAAEGAARFVVALADDPRLYEACGFEARRATARWLAIHEQRSVAVVERDLGCHLMVLPLGRTRWPDGTVDFLGHLF